MNKGKQEIIAALSDMEKLKRICHRWKDGILMPSVEALKELVEISRFLLFPGYFGDTAVNEKNIALYMAENIARLQIILEQQIKSVLYCETENIENRNRLDEIASKKANSFIHNLPSIREQLHSDVVAAYKGDPAAKSYEEVIFCYPAIRAITNYRIAHTLLQQGIPLIPRIITEMAHSETGIDIHPGARIGNSFTIDHGTGVVIGETAVIGENVKIYQGVTLGAKSFALDEKGNPIKGIDRHPRIGNNVVIYSNSTILGNITIGDNAIIGGNIWVDKDVPVGAKLVQKNSQRKNFELKPN